MLTRTITILGLLIAGILAIILLAYYVADIRGAIEAKSLDHTWAGPGLGGKYCKPSKISPVLDAPRSIQQDESAVVTLVVDVAPISEDEIGASPTCMLQIDLLAPKFDLMPTETTQTVEVSRGGQYIGRWIFAPKDVGTYRFAFTVNTCFGVIGVSVLNPLGLTARYAALLTIATAVFAPLIPKALSSAGSAITGWWSTFRRRRGDKK
jgi:hypothetical protein